MIHNGMIWLWVFQDLPGYGVLDYVSAWYWKAAKYIKSNPKVHVAFVSTNSITQGEQVGLLWGHLDDALRDQDWLCAPNLPVE